jgi:hypothetical protein
MPTIQIAAVSASKKLAGAMYEVVYTAPLTGISVTVNARMVSLNLALNAKVRMAIVPASVAFVDSAIPPADQYWVQPVDVVLGPAGVDVGVLEDTGIVLSPGESIVMYSDIPDVSVRVHGLARSMGV